MEKLCLFVVLAILSNVALGMSYRHKRQAKNDNEDSLEDRYGWHSHRRFPPRPSRRPVFPSPDLDNERVPPTNQVPVTTPAPTPNANGGNQATTTACLRTCPVTSEYNPVCGSNGITYDNPSRLACAQACRVDVTLRSLSRCRATTPAPIV